MIISLIQITEFYGWQKWDKDFFPGLFFYDCRESSNPKTPLTEHPNPKNPIHDPNPKTPTHHKCAKISKNEKKIYKE